MTKAIAIEVVERVDLEGGGKSVEQVRTAVLADGDGLPVAVIPTDLSLEPGEVVGVVVLPPDETHSDTRFGLLPLR